jgi:subtilisin-like proprotein convertase family protein
MKKITLLIITFICLQLQAQIVVSNTTSMAIPDNNATGISTNIITPAHSGNITSVSIDLDISHTWNGDLIATLTAPSGASVVIFDRPGTGTGCNDNGMNVTFIDGGAGDVNNCINTTATWTGEYNPENPFSTFNGENANGQWQLNISDNFSGDTGTLNSWTLKIMTNTLVTTYVPDDNFEQALIDLGYDAIMDDYVATVNINSITNLNVSSRDILDLTGINDFTALSTLLCQNNLLSTLDVSPNLTLNYLICFNNQLTTLNVSNNLTRLRCQSNLLTTLDLANNNMGDLSCENNQIGILDLSNSTNLYELYAHNNSLTQLNLSGNKANFQYCEIQHNQLTSVDLSNFPAIFEVNVSNNLLTVFNVKNGNNTNFTLFYAINNPNLTCIEVDDEVYSNTTNLWNNNKDASANFSNNCNTANVHDLDLNYIKIYPNPVKEILTIKVDETSIKKAVIYNLQGQKILETKDQTINVSQLSTGFYQVIIETEQGNRWSKKFIKN